GSVVPGTPWSLADVDARPAPLYLRPGDNEIWFLPVAHYGVPGLDRVLLALATLELRPGGYDQSGFDAALFAQEPAVKLSLAWRQSQPATVDVTLPAGVLLSTGAGTASDLVRREQTGQALDRGVDTLAAAGVVTTVHLAPFIDTQPHRDYLTR